MKKMILTFCIAWFSIANLPAQSSKTLNIEKITSIVDAYVADHNIPSVVVGIIQDGKLAHIINRGEKKRESGIGVDETTGYQIASLSKSFTAIILNHLAQDGLVDLNESVAHYIKDDVPAQALTKYEQMSLISVLQHKSGLPHNGVSVPPTPNGTAMKGGYTQEGFISDLTTLSIEEDKVGKFSYSNLGFGLLGHIAEKASGMTYEALLEKYILKPNDMKFTTSVLNDDTRARLAQPYMVGGDRTRETSAWEMGKTIPAGGILSNVEDLSKLMMAEMKAYKAYVQTGELSPYVLTADTYSLNSVMDYGYGFFKSKNSFDTTVVQLGHGGDVDGFGSHFEFYPESELGLIMLTSSGGPGFNEVKSMVERVMLGIPLPKEIEVSKDVLKKYVGKYQFESGAVIRLYRKGNQLKSYIQGWGSTDIFAESKTRFNWRGRNAAFEFELDKKGKVAKVIYHENGNLIYPKKIK